MNMSVIQSMINSVDKPAVFISPDYVIQAVNQAYRTTFPDPVQIGNSHCYWVSHRNPRPCDECGEACPLKHCQETGQASSVVHIHASNEGQSFCDIHMRPIRDANGDIFGYLEVQEKITYASFMPGNQPLIGESSAFKGLLKVINRVAKSDAAVLLQGETGTGKALISQVIHAASSQKNKPFVVVECRDLSETLFESELFGYEKAEIAAVRAQNKGLIDVADGGTVFFNEVGDLPLASQVKLLRLLETHYYRPVGSTTVKKARFRLICASHRDLAAMVKAGTFRQDLYYRIAEFPIDLPPLRDRQEDIELLCRHFLAQQTDCHRSFSRKAMTVLMNYPFPGNIRELKNIVGQAILMSDNPRIQADDLPQSVLLVALDSHNDNAVKSLVALEEDYLRNILRSYEDSLDALAVELGISTRTLYRKLRHHGIDATQRTK